jgi:predicted transcriptional regulator
MKIESYFNHALGQKITFYREKAGLTLTNLSDITKIEIEDIKAYESGSVSIQVEDFLRIIKALEIDSSQLVDGITL